VGAKSIGIQHKKYIQCLFQCDFKALRIWLGSQFFFTGSYSVYFKFKTKTKKATKKFLVLKIRFEKITPFFGHLVTAITSATDKFWVNC
jgi:hypothetical protein